MKNDTQFYSTVHASSHKKSSDIKVNIQMIKYDGFDNHVLN